MGGCGRGFAGGPRFRSKLIPERNWHYLFLVRNGTPRKLPIQWGCALAFALSASFVAIVMLRIWWVTGHRFRTEDLPHFLVEMAIISVPFVALAIARTRDWLAWFLAVALTAGVWGYYLYQLYMQDGVNFLLGFIQTIGAPIVITGVCLTIAGVRGRIPDWGID